EAVIAILATLKAGGAYVPLDPSYPEQRLAFMQSDARAALLVTERRLIREPRAEADRPSGGRLVCGAQEGARVLCLDSDGEAEAIARESTDNLPSRVTASQAAYVIYTSGSTGKPKGVVGLHCGAVNRLRWAQRIYPYSPNEVSCQKTSLSFVDSIA